MKNLVTGRAGSGKSGIHHEFLNREINSVDMDKFPGLSNWVDLETGKKIHGFDASGLVDYTKVAWSWDSNILKGVLKAKKDMFFCGSASNDMEFFGDFDNVFVLDVNPDVQTHRLETRDSLYGKDPAMQSVILAEQAEFVAQAISLGAIAIKNNDTPTEAVDEILRISQWPRNI